MSVPKAWIHTSIQDLLVSHGFQIDQDHGWFSKQTVGEEHIIIPFSELMGHTVGTFLGKAERRGWQLTAGSATASEQALLPFI
jgi:hypothetical protein